jgi:hypothetical protein
MIGLLRCFFLLYLFGDNVPVSIIRTLNVPSAGVVWLCLRSRAFLSTSRTGMSTCSCLGCIVEHSTAASTRSKPLYVVSTASVVFQVSYDGIIISIPVVPAWITVSALPLIRCNARLSMVLFPIHVARSSSSNLFRKLKVSWKVFMLAESKAL